MNDPALNVGKNVVQQVAGKTGKAALRNLNPFELLHEYFDYLKIVQQSETARENIRAKRDIAIQSLQSNERIILAYFEKRFAERKEALSNFYNLLSAAIQSKDDKQLEVALAGIVGIIKDNPLGDFQTFKENMLSEDFNIEL